MRLQLHKNNWKDTYWALLKHINIFKKEKFLRQNRFLPRLSRKLPQIPQIILVSAYPRVLVYGLSGHSAAGFCRASPRACWANTLLQMNVSWVIHTQSGAGSGPFSVFCSVQHRSQISFLQCAASISIQFFAACSIDLKSVCLLRAFWSACKMSFEGIIKIQSKPILWTLAGPNYKNCVMKTKLWKELATKLGIQCQFLYIQSWPQVSSLKLTLIGVPLNSFLQFTQKILIFQKKLFLRKIFSKEICDKKGYINFWHKMTWSHDAWIWNVPHKRYLISISHNNATSLRPKPSGTTRKSCFLVLVTVLVSAPCWVYAAQDPIYLREGWGA